MRRNSDPFFVDFLSSFLFSLRLNVRYIKECCTSIDSTAENVLLADLALNLNKLRNEKFFSVFQPFLFEFLRTLALSHLKMKYVDS